MAVARVQFKAGNNGTGGPLVLNLTSAVTSGNLLFLLTWVFCKPAGTYAGGNWVDLSTIGDNTGVQNWNTVYDSNYGRMGLQNRASAFVLPVVSSTTLQAITIYQPLPCIAYAVEYSGLAGIFDGATIGQVNLGTTWSTPAITTTGTGMLITFAGAPFAQPVTFAAGTSYTLISENDDSAATCAACAVERLNTAAATYNGNGTTAASQEVEAFTIAYK